VGELSFATFSGRCAPKLASASEGGAGGIIYMIPALPKVRIKMDSPKAVNPTHSKIRKAFDFLTRRLITILIYCGAGGIRTLPKGATPSE